MTAKQTKADLRAENVALRQRIHELERRETFLVDQVNEAGRVWRENQAELRTLRRERRVCVRKHVDDEFADRLRTWLEEGIKLIGRAP